MDRPANRPWVIGHRGASTARRENTVAAFRHAFALGADAVELDVRRTADGGLVVHHDAVVNGIGPIVQLDTAEVATRAPWIPTFDEAIDACAGMWINVEIKNSPADPDWDPEDRAVDGVLASLTTRDACDRALVSSFNLQTAVRAAGACRDLTVGWLIDRGIDPIGAIAGAADASMDSLHPHAAALSPGIAEEATTAAHAAGLLLITWTVDDPVEIRRLAAAGVDGIITNVPDAARSALDDCDRDGG
jgi:glycerophosphoryl diester phosphodiesterase